MQHLETCLLIAEANRVLCRLILLCFNRRFALDLQMKFICYQESLIIMTGVLTGFLVEKCAARPKSVRKSSFPKTQLVFVLHLAGCVRGFQSRGAGRHDV